MSAHPDQPRPPLSVWPTAQQPASAQRRGRYVPASTAHPAKMLPAIAAHAIASYSAPGDVVFDPMCGIGTTLVEAVHLGRDALGVEYEPRWARLARANLHQARAQGAAGTGRVITGDARRLPDLVDEDLFGGVALVVTSPPYGAHTHGHVRTSRNSRRRGVDKWDHRYSRDPANLAHRGLAELLAGFTTILAGCLTLLRPGGIVAVTVRPYRLRGELVDLPAAVLNAARDAGLEPFDRLVALLCGLRGDELVPRASFFALHEARKARARGLPAHVVAHEDVVVLRKTRPDSGSTDRLRRRDSGRRSGRLRGRHPRLRPGAVGGMTGRRGDASDRLDNAARGEHRSTRPWAAGRARRMRPQRTRGGSTRRTQARPGPTGAGASRLR